LRFFCGQEKEGKKAAKRPLWRVVMTRELTSGILLVFLQGQTTFMPESDEKVRFKVVLKSFFCGQKAAGCEENHAAS
jgi:hypothetical protein